MRPLVVADIMTTDVVSVGPLTPFKKIVEVMIGQGVSAVPVVDEEGHPIGVVSESDLLAKEERSDKHDEDSSAIFATSRARQLERKSTARVARDVMSSPIRTVRSTAPIARAARWLARSGTRRLFVVENDRIVGVMSRRDLLKAYLRNDDDIQREVETDVLARVLWAEPGEIDVAVQDGVVSLDGRLEADSDIDIAVGLIKAMPGVVAVETT